jgi:hypothetical protein
MLFQIICASFSVELSRVFAGLFYCFSILPLSEGTIFDQWLEITESSLSERLEAIRTVSSRVSA